MVRHLRGGRHAAAVIVALTLLVTSASSAFAHARYDRSEPPAGAALDGSPFVLRAYFTQELTSRSTIRVLDASGTQVDLMDGHVDLDDPDRKAMVVSLPQLPEGVYTVEFTTVSAEDGDDFTDRFAFGVGMAPPTASGQPAPAADLSVTADAYISIGCGTTELC